jgi:hypothetical protein
VLWGSQICHTLAIGPAARRLGFFCEGGKVVRVNKRGTGFAVLSVALTCSAQEFHPDIPKAWDDKEVARLEVPRPASI